MLLHVSGDSEERALLVARAHAEIPLIADYLSRERVSGRYAASENDLIVSVMEFLGLRESAAGIAATSDLPKLKRHYNTSSSPSGSPISAVAHGGSRGTR